MLSVKLNVNYEFAFLPFHAARQDSFVSRFIARVPKRASDFTRRDASTRIHEIPRASWDTYTHAYTHARTHARTDTHTHARAHARTHNTHLRSTFPGRHGCVLVLLRPVWDFHASEREIATLRRWTVVILRRSSQKADWKDSLAGQDNV
jgi:hypothetical protein